jgi:hypothetical protein
MSDVLPILAEGLGVKPQRIAVIVTLLFLGLVIELVRRRRLVERYALLWISAALVLVVLAVWNGALNWIADALGILSPPNALFLIGVGALFVLALHFSVAFSRLSEETKILAQEVARLDREQRRIRSRGLVAFLCGGPALGVDRRSTANRGPQWSVICSWLGARGRRSRSGPRLAAALRRAGVPGHLRQIRAQPLPLGCRQRRQHLGLGAFGCPLRLGEPADAVIGQLEQVAAAIVGIAATDQRAVGLELVDQGDEVAGMDPQRAPERLLRHRTGLVELVQDRELGSPQPDRRQGIPEALARGTREPEEEHPATRLRCRPGGSGGGGHSGANIAPFDADS